MSQNDDSKQNEKARGIVESGAEIAGGAVGAALGMYAAGPAGAAAFGAAGSAAALVLKGLGNEVAERVLGPREKVRAGGVIAIAAANIKARSERGEQLRQDGFFDKSVNNRSAADEVAESVLMKAQREAEEQKIVHLGFLISNISFDPNVSAQLAHQIIRIAEQLTYRQLCLLKLFALKSEFNLRNGDYRGQQKFEKDLLQILYEVYDLYSRGLINIGGSVAFGPSDINPAGSTVQGL